MAFCPPGQLLPAVGLLLARGGQTLDVDDPPPPIKRTSVHTDWVQDTPTDSTGHPLVLDWECLVFASLVLYSSGCISCGSNVLPISIDLPVLESHMPLPMPAQVVRPERMLPNCTSLPKLW